MHAEEAREVADKFNGENKTEDYLDDRIVDGMFDDISMASSEGAYSYEYNATAGLNPRDLRYCKDKLEEAGFEVEVNYDDGIVKINW